MRYSIHSTDLHLSVFCTTKENIVLHTNDHAQATSQTNTWTFTISYEKCHFLASLSEYDDTYTPGQNLEVGQDLL